MPPPSEAPKSLALTKLQAHDRRANVAVIVNDDIFRSWKIKLRLNQCLPEMRKIRYIWSDLVLAIYLVLRIN